MQGRYWQIIYKNEPLLRVWASTKSEALTLAKTACIRYGYRGMEYALMKAE